MAQVTLNATETAFMDAASATTNFSSIQADIGESRLNTEKRRSLLTFNLSSIPAGSTITGVTCKMYNTGGDLTDNNRTARAYRVRRNWSLTQVTWNVYTTGNSWSTAGCGDTTNDRESTELGTLSCVNPPSAGYLNSTFDATLVQGWLDGTFTNNGLVWIMDTETNDMQRFDGDTGTNPPQLVIDYTPPASFMIMF